MGTSIESIHGNDCAPLRIHGKPLTPISYASPVSSAQVKSCILLAGLYAEGKTSVTEPYVSRNHSEGTSIESIHGNDCAPLRIHGKPLTPISYASPVSSAQVKSCILLAGLYAEGKTSVTEPYVSRNHSELMLSAFGAEITCQGTTASVLGHPKLQGQSIEVPGDISSAAYFIAAGLLIPESEILIKNVQGTTASVLGHPKLQGQSIEVPGDISSAAYFIAAGLLIPESEILIKNVGINPTRDGILRVCRQMGGKVEILNERKEGLEPVADLLVTSSSLHGTVIEKELIPTLIDELPVIAVMAEILNERKEGLEPVADLLVTSSSLHGTVIEKELIPTLIDELPVIAVMAAFANGTTIIRDAEELKVKESNRLLLPTAQQSSGTPKN